MIVTIVLHRQNSMNVKHLSTMLSRFICKQCDYKAANKRNLLMHIKSIHEGIKFPCEQCDYKATLKKNLMTHIKSRHEGIKFPCVKCDYKATYKGNLLKLIQEPVLTII